MTKKFMTNLKIVVIILLILLFIKVCLIFLWPFVLSIFIAFLIEPIIKFFINKNLTRKISVILSIILCSSFISLIVFYVSKYAYTQLLLFFNKLPDIILFIINNTKYLKEKNINYNKIVMTISTFIYSYKEKIIKFIMSATTNLVYIIIIFINTVFISMDLDKIKSSIEKFTEKKVEYILKNVSTKLTKMIIVESRLVLTSTFLTTFGFYVLGYERPLTLGLLCGILDILPVVGISIVFFPMIIYEFIKKNLYICFGLVALYILLQISREILELKFVGKNLKLHPIVTLFSVYVGVLLYGVWGVILGPILVILFKEIIECTIERSITFIL